MLWLWGSLAVLLVQFVVLCGFVHVRFLFSKDDDNERLLVDFKTLFGLLRYRYEIPVIKFRWLEGVTTQTEQVDRNEAKKLKEQNSMITRKTVMHFYKKTKLLEANVAGFSKWLTDSLSHVHCTKVRWVTNIGIGDAAETAVITGMAWAIKTSFLGFIFKFIDLNTMPQLAVNPQYNRPQFSTELLCILKFRLGYAIIAGLLLIVRIMKVKGGVKTWQNTLFKA